MKCEACGARSLPHGLLSTGDGAERFGVTRKTVYDWTVKGHLRAVNLPGGQHRYRPEDVDNLIAAAEEP